MLGPDGPPELLAEALQKSTGSGRGSLWDSAGCPCSRWRRSARRNRVMAVSAEIDPPGRRRVSVARSSSQNDRSSRVWLRRSIFCSDIILSRKLAAETMVSPLCGALPRSGAMLSSICSSKWALSARMAAVRSSKGGKVSVIEAPNYSGPTTRSIEAFIVAVVKGLRMRLFSPSS